MTVKDKIHAIEAITEPLSRRLEKCDICPRNCGVNRIKGERGYCGMDANLVVFTSFLHQGEEPAISGENGSGTIFFSGCNLKCVYCQNYKFSHLLEGKIIDEKKLADIMLELQRKGAHNINLVTPTHFLPQILGALLLAYSAGLDLPIVYNTSSFDKPEIISLINDIVDIYLADMKYVAADLAHRYSHALEYPFEAQKSIRKMYEAKQQPLFDNDLMKQGLVIRHLVLPGHFEDSLRVLLWIKEHTPQAYLSLMFQYQPYFKANKYAKISSRVNEYEYEQVRNFLEEIDLQGWAQDLNSNDNLAGVYFEKE